MKVRTVFFITIILTLVVTVQAAKYVDMEPDGIFVGGAVLPDTIRFDPNTLDELICFAPTTERPVYEIAIPIGDWEQGPGATIERVTINGVICRSFTVYAAGYSHLDQHWITRKAERTENVVVLANALWHNSERIEARIDISHADHPQSRIVTGKAPARGGMPAGTVHYESFALVEDAGIDRIHEPCEVSVSVYPDEVSTPDGEGGLGHELRVYRVVEGHEPELISSQVFDTGGVPGRPDRDTHTYIFSPSKTARVFFFAEVPAHSSVIYVLTYGNPSPPPVPVPGAALRITGKAPGFTVSNSHYVCDLEKKSGQIKSLHFAGEGAEQLPELTNHLTAALHWNPDAYGANGKWGHTFAWDPPDHINIVADGPLLFRVTNTGRMPDEAPQVYASVSYSFYADVPYIGVTTMMDVRDHYSASAIRNGEIVVDSHLMTHFAWKDKAGTIRQIPTMAKPGVLDEPAVMTEPDIPWAAMINEYDRYGIAAIWTVADAFQREEGTRPVHRPGYFFYCHHIWATPLTYFTRAWVYPFSHKGRRPNVPIEPGAVFVERGVFYPFQFEGKRDRYDAVEHISAILHNPLRRENGN